MTQTSVSQPASLSESGENTWLWLIKIVTGPLLLVLIIVHLIVNHFIAETGLLTYADVVAYYRNPLIPIMEITFLATVVTHSLSGLRGIILDLKPARNLLRIIDWALVIFGISAVVYGTWLALTIASRGV
jgi:succinate dehydrogenase / fumarate reductase membrane anchor subunit